MKTYEVTVYESVYHTVFVEAENDTVARAKGQSIVVGGLDGIYNTESEGINFSKTEVEEVM